MFKEKNKIVAWLNEYNIKNYKLVADDKYGFIVDVPGDVCLSDNQLKHIPVKFNIVNGNFDCNNNELTSLDFCPKLVNGYFSCSFNKLASLEFFSRNN